MSLAATCIKRPVLATVLNIIILILGAIGFTYLGVRDYPSVDPSIVTVSTSFPGANADVIETQITEPLESAINGIPGIRSISSSSRDGSSRITVEFNLEVEMETAANDVRDKVSGALRRLPRDVDPPVVEKADADANPIFGVSLRSERRSMIDLSDYAEINFKERLQTISGVSSVGVWGSKKMSIRLKMDPTRLAAYGITPLDVRNAVTNENVELPSGRVEGDNIELSVRTFGRFRTIDDFNNMIVYQDGERLVRFNDIGIAEIEPENMRVILKLNGIPAVSCNLIPLPGANYIDIVDRAKIVIEELKKDLPEDIIVETTFDNTVFIRQSLGEVRTTIFEAFALVVLIIFLFLRSWRTTLIPVLAIPISLIGVFFVMYLAGFSINILTLFAVVLSIGLVVDDAIVMMENIYTKIEAGMAPKEAGIAGSKEIYFAVISTTVALVAVFFPIVFLQGVTGRLFREFSVVIAGAVCISSIVALTFTPMITTKLLTRNATENWFYRVTEPFFIGFNNVYRRSLNWFMRFRYIALVIVAAAISLIVWMWSELPSEMAPLEDRSYLTINSVAQEGITFDYMNRYVDEMVAIVDDQIPGEYENLMGGVGMGGVNASWLRIKLVQPEDRSETQQQIADKLNPIVRQMTGARSFVTQQQTFGGRRGGLPVAYVIQAKNLEDLKKYLPTFMDEVNKSPVFAASDLNMKFTKPEVTISINREKAALLGLSVQNIAQTLQLTMSEQRIGYYIYNGKQYQILSQYDRINRNKPTDLTDAYVRNTAGELIQLDNVVSIQESSTPPQLYRYNRFVSATVSAGLAKGYTLGQGIEEMDRIAGHVLSDDFSTTLSGDSKDFVESTSSLMFAFILALVLIYLVLAAQFESFRDPLIVMFTVPLSVMGALLAMKLYGQTLNIFSQIGIIMLIGLVTKNGILIVEFANQRREAGLSLMEAIKDASVSRFRPILMTSLSTILGILPLALATGAGAESRIAMGIAVVGGMICATLFSLYVIPAIYTFLTGETRQQQD
ncbi:MAG: efflux RND transporter permease subunit [Bacteroidales bacterium]|nr:efflux RND transporter permease subunit [Bacteroidales bacterium]MCL2133084.1 efflux RND transporter permease subunit [Bacteroidales bacterium]